ncbi:hypothetical protein RIEGSTA812A_PEG_252 [invertebrate metagenome]|uniref:Uncharacterized protein n=1 Tax=invertebrate metagenome TaxID=1711999 RepID=A0A484H4S1_9ZZZZ
MRAWPDALSPLIALKRYYPSSITSIFMSHCWKTVGVDRSLCCGFSRHLGARWEILLERCQPSLPREVSRAEGKVLTDLI